MKKLASMISHMGVIGLALLALLVATVVWLFERLGDSGSAATASTDAAVWREADLGNAALETTAPLICEEEATGGRFDALKAAPPLSGRSRENQPVD